MYWRTKIEQIGGIFYSDRIRIRAKLARMRNTGHRAWIWIPGMYMETTTFPSMNKDNGETVPLRNYLLFAVASNDFNKFKIAVNSTCNGSATVKMGTGLNVASNFYL